MSNPAQSQNYPHKWDRFTSPIISPNPYSHHNSGTPGTPGTYLHLGSMGELPLLTPQCLQSDLRGRICKVEGATLLSPTAITTHDTLIYRGGRNPKTWGTNMSSRFVQDRGSGYTYRSKLCRACTQVPISGWSPISSELTKPILPCEFSVVTVPFCIRTSKWSLVDRIAPELWNALVWPHGSRSERRWAHSHFSPTDTPLSYR
jgi:hypothetical protein